MALGIIIFAIIGWILGVHLPWWGVLGVAVIGTWAVLQSPETENTAEDMSIMAGVVYMVIVYVLTGS